MILIKKKCNQLSLCKRLPAYKKVSLKTLGCVFTNHSQEHFIDFLHITLPCKILQN